MDKPCVYTGPGGSFTDWICYLVPNGSSYESGPIWNRTVPVSNQSCVNRVDTIPDGSERIRSRVNITLISKTLQALPVSHENKGKSEIVAPVALTEISPLQPAVSTCLSHRICHA